MIISKSNNFAVMRAPKTGGTSLQAYMFESGLVDRDADTYILDGGFKTWDEFKAFSEANGNLEYTSLPESMYGTEMLSGAHKTYSKAVEEGLLEDGTPCIGTIRHPLEWMASLFAYANIRRKIEAQKNLRLNFKYSDQDIALARQIAEPNASFDFTIFNKFTNDHVWNAVKPQTLYYPKDAELFNIENIHEHASEFIASKGGVAPTRRIELRKTSSVDLQYFIDNITPGRKQVILEDYEDDLIAWEKAYAKFN